MCDLPPMLASTRFPLGSWAPTSSVRVVNVVKKSTQPLGLSLCWNYNSEVECTQSQIHVKENTIHNVTIKCPTPLLGTALRLLSIFSQITHKSDYYICLTTDSLSAPTTVSWVSPASLQPSLDSMGLFRLTIITELLPLFLYRRIVHVCFRVTSLTNVSSTIATGGVTKQPLLSLADQSLSDIT
jgi:hypothetical protein